MKSISYTMPFIKKQFSTEQLFMISMLVVNGGNYFYNLILGRVLGPEAFADAAILITFLLILSFVGMTFQIVTTKYIVVYNERKKVAFTKLITKAALLSGIAVGALIMIFSSQLQSLFHTQSAGMFFIFGIGIPLYFLMSVKRGVFQGKNDLHNLSKTYIAEMLSRLLLTVTVVLLVPNLPTTLIVAAGITLSFVFGLQPFQKTIFRRSTLEKREILNTKNITSFFALTAFYELTQIIINNSDVILVKHYFNNTNAGLYASLALIGRVVYFVAWMFVMLLLPKVILLKKEGKNTQPILLKYVAYIAILSSTIVLVTYFFPEEVILVLFGDKYLSIAFLLWKYALATSIFAIANIFAYYFLSINKYLPVVASAVLGFTQIILIILFHNSLEQVVEMQIISMFILLVFQLAYFFYQNKRQVGLN
jgi:O-antigen/teichoic acid export membrane protein